MLSANLINAAAGTPWYLDTKTWVLIPVVLFIALVIYKGALKALNKSLDDRADAIKAELEEARRLREEAQQLLASYHRKQKEAEAQAMSEVKAKAADMALNTAETYLRTKLSAADKTKLIKDGIAQMGSTLG